MKGYDESTGYYTSRYYAKKYAINQNMMTIKVKDNSYINMWRPEHKEEVRSAKESNRVPWWKEQTPVEFSKWLKEVLDEGYAFTENFSENNS